ncbi:hypothetical protein Golax_021816 [Gossypium laxum]|uniref:F-box domain-containing protein n=1 Tax=Gossypium laxum TaxID=34288 RepID=A0A7J9AMI1_9ROSI|nr:hypothetical protein [Gossypium laxum]
MSQSDYSYSSLPKEISLKIASLLEAPDLSSLACSSRAWLEICASGDLWKPLFKERWPLLCGSDEDPNFKDWRGFYFKQHKEKKLQAESVINLVEKHSLSGSLNAVDYLRALSFLGRMQFSFRDVQMLLLKPKLNVLLNLIGLHYCLNNLQVPVNFFTINFRLGSRQNSV